MTSGARLLDRFAELTVVVVGDAVLDVYLQGSAERLCREGPVPVVRLDSRSDLPGAAANTAANVAALGATARLVGVTGRDWEGELLRSTLADHGVDTGALVDCEGRRTLSLHRLLAGAQLLARYDEGSTCALEGDAEEKVLDRLRHALAGADAVILSDYDHGVLTPRVLAALAEHQQRCPHVLVVDSKNPARFRELAPTAVKPNWGEAVRMLGAGELDGVSERAEGIAVHGDRLLELTGAQIAAVTLDTEGAIVFERGRPPHRTYAQGTPKETGSTGAGDTFVAALALALAAGAHTPAAAELASAGSAVVVGKAGTAMCSAAELRAQLVGRDKYLCDLDALAARVELYRQRGERILFTNGCFDILHRGHITYLNRAKNLADVLIVGLNDDDSVRRLKGPARPINPLEDRAQVLAALSCVDHIVPFSGDSPTEAIRAIRPDLYVKGGDYTVDRLPEASLVEELGGTVQLLPFMEDRSTTGIIERIRAVEQRVG